MLNYKFLRVQKDGFPPSDHCKDRPWAVLSQGSPEPFHWILRVDEMRGMGSSECFVRRLAP